MKAFNEKTEAILTILQAPTGYDHKEGERVPHNQFVDIVEKYIPVYDQLGGVSCYAKAYFSADDILNLADQIREIQATTINLPFTTLPF